MRRTILVVIATAAIVACGDNATEPTGPDRDPTGTYQLATVTGKALPYPVSGGFIVSGSLRLDQNHAYVVGWGTLYTGSGTMVRDSTVGAWSRTDNTLRFTPGDLPVRTLDALYDGEAITVQDGLSVFVYRR